MQELIKSNSRLLKIGSAIVLGAIFILTAFPKVQKQRRINKIKNSFFVGLELGGTNYTIIIQRYIKSDPLIFETIVEKGGSTTQNPTLTFAKIKQQIQDMLRSAVRDNPQMNGEICFIGIASFGPLCLEGNNQGQILNSPKVNWRQFNVKKQIQKWYPFAQINVQSDVNASAWAEFKSGDHEAVKSLAYVTVGTGVGVGVVLNGQFLHGLTHIQGGHIHIIPHAVEQTDYPQFKCQCPIHQNCLEGYVNSKAIAMRLGIEESKLHQVQDSNGVWELIGYYLAQLSHSLTLLYSPQVIVFGGGVFNRKPILTAVRKYFCQMLNKYVQHRKLEKQNIHQYIKKSNIPYNGCIGIISTAKLHEQ